MIAFVFPGQGSQRKGMGAPLFDRYPALVARADGVLGYSVRELVLDNPANRLDQTEYTQPALYVVNALEYRARVEQFGRTPDFVAGHSLGEYSALFAAGVFDFDTGLRLVQRRAQLMARARDGGMMAIVGLTARQVSDVIAAHTLASLDIANQNAPDQIVIAGPRQTVRDAAPCFTEAGASACIPLRTSGAFHSRYMQPALEEFRTFLSQFEFTEPEIPVISNVMATPHARHDIADLLCRQLTSVVLWSATVEYLLRCGVDRFEEVGAGKVLTGLIDKVRTAAQTAVPRPLVSREVPERPPQVEADREIRAETLGSAEFRQSYNVKYAYVAGAMYKGIASKELVIRMGRAGLIGYLGTGGMRLPEIEDAIRQIQRALPDGQSYGMNLLCNLAQPEFEDRTVDLFLKCGIQNVEAAAFMSMTPAIIRFRLAGCYRAQDGTARSRHRIMAKVSRPEVADVFMSPPPERVVAKLLQAGQVTPEQAELGRSLPVSEDICVEADSGGHTDSGVALVLMPAMLRLRDDIQSKHGYRQRIRIGAAGGIGAPESAAAAFILGADFILTGSINQCTVQAGTSDAVKDMLQTMNVQDTEYAPAGDMFELGAKIQVLRKGLFFPARANKLYELYRRYNSLDEIDEKTARQIQDKYFHRSFEAVWQETQAYLAEHLPAELVKAEHNPKYKMSLVFRWYFVHSARLAMQGSPEHKVDYQIQCGPALGAFNEWVRGTPLEHWKNRHVDEIAQKLMEATAALLTSRFRQWRGVTPPRQAYAAHV